MAKVFTIDVSMCSGCHNCQIVCKDEFAGNEWLPYSKAQPDIGQFWMKVVENVRGTTPKVKVHYLPHMCNHCDNPVCMAACKANAITKRDDGLVLIAPTKCTGCKACMEACPYDVIYFNDEQNIAQKCTGCAHLLDNGYKLPRCVEACPTDALKFGEEEEMQDFVVGADVMKPETGCKPRVYYRNIPGRFIAGLVYDPVEKEIIRGARCLLKNGGKQYETFTDAFGDFWFRDLPVGKFDLAIHAKGYESKYWKDLSSADDLNLGEIPLDKA